jgi:hypothetical protein
MTRNDERVENFGSGRAHTDDADTQLIDTDFDTDAGADGEPPTPARIRTSRRSCRYRRSLLGLGHCH